MPDRKIEHFQIGQGLEEFENYISCAELGAFPSTGLEGRN